MIKREERECQDDYSNQVTDMSVTNVNTKVERQNFNNFFNSEAFNTINSGYYQVDNFTGAIQNYKNYR